MARLKDRNRQIPNGFQFLLPEVGYKNNRFDSFQKIVTDVLFIIQGNPTVATQRGWPQNKEDVEDWVDDFNARYCEHNGWDDYITGKGEQTHPKSMPLQTKVAALAAGAKSLAEWLGNGSNPVGEQLAADRAKVCAACPMNEPGDLTNFFERATADLIRRHIESAHDLKLVTPHHSKLGICSGCYCPLKLKVFTPLDIILRNMTPVILGDLASNCWIISEGRPSE